VSHDVVVIGAGIVGAATAWELHRRGADVLLLDRGEVSRGTTGVGEGNVLCADKDAGPDLDLAVLGRALYDQIEAELGAVAKIRRKGALVVHPDERTWADEPARVERLNAAGVEARLVDPAEARELEPRLTGAIHGATFVPGDLQCDPRAIAEELARRAGPVRTRAEVTEILADDGLHRGVRFGEGGVRGVRLAGGEVIECSDVVLAAGPWSAELLPSLPLEPRKGQLSRLALRRPDEGFLRRKVVDASYLLNVASDDAGRQTSTVVETTIEGDVLVGSSRERVGFEPSVSEDLSSELRAKAARLIPELASLRHVGAWVGFRPWLPDHRPAIGRAGDGLYVATGHEGAGVGQGPITGRLVAQAICGEPTDMDLGPFDPSRF
jgi:D-hydroxyproline dehydrogenase subunit beta